MYCDWHNHNFINMESRVVKYNDNFCMTLIENHLNTLQIKYVIITEVLLVLDEWVFLTTGRRFFEEADDRTTFRRYSLMVKKCQAQKNIEGCAPLCREFNLNKASYMWDGESEPFE